MKKLSIIILLPMFSLLLLNSCEDFVTGVDPLISYVQDSDLDSPEQVPFLIRGVKQQFAYTTDDLFVSVAALSDEFIFDLRTPTAVYPQFEEIEKGEILPGNFVIAPVNSNIGKLRFVADDLLRRIGTMSGLSTDAMKEAKYIGNFYGGVARYFGATYLGLNAGTSTGGAPINGGQYIESPELYKLAIAKMETALQFANDAQKKIVNTLIAKAYLYQGEYAKAASHVDSGLTDTDTPLQALYTLQNPHYFGIEAGPAQRSQLTANPRFQGYIDADANEAARIPLIPVTGTDGVTTFYIQSKYPGQDDPINLVSWQENNLMKAELILRNMLTGTVSDAQALINAVRASHGIAALTITPTLDTIYEERDKELFITGNRLPDQRRFGKWHLGANTWQFLPISQEERDHNKNL